MPNTIPFMPDRETAFPLGDYTPYGYLHTPNHRGLNPSGILRSVPPLGFGIFNRGLPWYGMDALRAVNHYISILRPSVAMDGLLLAEREDFDHAGIALCSHYHSGNVMSYDFTVGDLVFSLAWYRINDDALGLRVFILNKGGENRRLTFNVSHLYGMNGKQWWGSDAATLRYVPEQSVLVSKILAYGDVFTLISDSSPSEGVSALDEAQLRTWLEGKISLDGKYQSRHLPQSACGAMRWEWEVSPQVGLGCNIVLARGVNENTSRSTACNALKEGEAVLLAGLERDQAFYRGAPILEGDWPETWKHGWIYDFETLRMNLMAPAGIYRHVWDGMQTVWPRVVSGETSIDMLTLSYADISTAMEVMEGMFEDAPDVYIPCTREDGSVNMIGEDGSECATAPIWGMPMRAIRIMLARSGDLLWIKRLYPRLKRYIEWWQKNRTDSEGWYHCNNSWESGQDGSARFVSDADSGNGPKMAANAEHVRTADLEAAMASAMEDMAYFAKLLGYQDDEAYYRDIARQGRERTQSMFVEKCFRDFDARNGKPFLNTARYDMMLTMPVALGMATEQQKAAMIWLFNMYDKETEKFYTDSDTARKAELGYAPYWPPLLQTLVEAAHQMEDPERPARMVIHMVDPAYRRNDARKHWPGKTLEGIPEHFSMYIPGNGRENLAEDIPISGCENYGWGCLAPMLIFENIIGLRPLDPLGRSFVVRPVLPDLLKGKIFKVLNVSHGPFRFDLSLERRFDGIEGIRVQMRFTAKPGDTVFIRAGVDWTETKDVDITLPLYADLAIRG
jgi:hypothetical protein